MLQIALPQKKKKPDASEPTEESSEMQMERFGKAMFQKYGRPLLALGIGWLAAFSIGYVYVSGGEDYYVAAEEPSYFLVRRYGDTYIFKEVDIESMELRGGIKIQKVGDGKELSLKRVWISSLRNPNRKTFYKRLRFAFLGYENRKRPPENSYRGPY